jgi:hypothetical protein
MLLTKHALSFSHHDNHRFLIIDRRIHRMSVLLHLLPMHHLHHCTSCFCAGLMFHRKVCCTVVVVAAAALLLPTPLGVRLLDEQFDPLEDFPSHQPAQKKGSVEEHDRPDQGDDSAARCCGDNNNWWCGAAPVGGCEGGTPRAVVAHDRNSSIRSQHHHDAVVGVVPCASSPSSICLQGYYCGVIMVLTQNVYSCWSILIVLRLLFAHC